MNLNRKDQKINQDGLNIIFKAQQKVRANLITLARYMITNPPEQKNRCTGDLLSPCWCPKSWRDLPNAHHPSCIDIQNILKEFIQ
jgi:hypothetical protein